MTASVVRGERSALITGVGGGIGAAAARELLRRGWRVFGSVRRREEASRLQGLLGKGFTPLRFDLCDPRAVARGVAQVRRALGGRGLDALINNAGITVLGPLAELDVQALRRQFDVNLFGLFDVTRRFLPLLGVPRRGEGPPGRIVNLSSVSGRIAYPFFGAYAASKHAVEALSDALRRELHPYGVRVILIQPAIVATPLVEKSRAQAEAFREGDYARAMEAALKVTQARRALAPERVARVIARALESPRPRARYALARNRLTGWVLPRLLPAKALDRVVARALHLRPRDVAPETGRRR